MPDNAAALVPDIKLTYWPLGKIVRSHWRDPYDPPWKIKTLFDRITTQGFRGHLDAFPLPDGRIEMVNGNTRKTVLEMMGTWMVNGTLTNLVPFNVREMSVEEARNIFWSDNDKEDQQTTAWALGSIRTMLPEFIEQGMARSEAHAKLADGLRLEPKYIQRLADLDAAITDGRVTEEVKGIPMPINAVLFWARLQQLMSLRFVPLSEQERHLGYILNGEPDIPGRIKETFKPLLEEAAPLRLAPQKREKNPFLSVCQYFDKLADLLREHGDGFGPEETAAINSRARYVESLLPDSQAAEELAKIDAVLADMMEETDGV